jgi:hypothetical protein
MKKFSFGLLAAALLASPVLGDDTAPEAKPEVCPVVDASAVVCTEKCAHEHEMVMTTMMAVPEGEVATDGNVDPTLMYMTGVVDDAGGPTRHQEGENFRDLSVQTLGGVSTLGGGAKFEGLTQVAAERRAFGSERTAGAGDKSSLKSMFFGNKAEAKTKTTLVANDRARMQKMAEVDQLRDKALKTGDAKLLAKAEAMEQELKVGAKAKTKFSLFGRK